MLRGEPGWQAAGDLQDDLLDRECAAIERLLTLPAQTADGRAAKVVEKQINLLFGEVLATQSALTNVLYELKLIEPRLGDAIARGFDNAASQLENLTIQAGKAGPPEHLAKAPCIVEDLWTASLGRHGGNPKHGV